MLVRIVITLQMMRAMSKLWIMFVEELNTLYTIRGIGMWWRVLVEMWRVVLVAKDRTMQAMTQ